jgi:hypothetical protein
LIVDRPGRNQDMICINGTNYKVYKLHDLSHVPLPLRITPLEISVRHHHPTTKGKPGSEAVATPTAPTLYKTSYALAFRHHRQCASHFPCASYASFSIRSISRGWCTAPWTTAWCSATSFASSFLRLRHAARISLNSARSLARGLSQQLLGTHLPVYASRRVSAY